MIGQSDQAEPAPENLAALMARHGIARVPADQFHVDGFRYTNLADALAQARRADRKEGP
jgi:hypothetical protein